MAKQAVAAIEAGGERVNPLFDVIYRWWTEQSLHDWWIEQSPPCSMLFWPRTRQID
jgi:hypothetical protein